MRRDDPYVVVGALAASSFLAIGVALLVGLRPAWRGGRALAVATLIAVAVLVRWDGTPSAP